MDNNANLVAVPFYSDTVWAVEQDGEVSVAMKPICETLGLKWNGQFERLKRTAVLAKGIRVTRIPSPGGEQEMVCLPLEMLPGWLFGVDISRAKPGMRPRLERYQAECFKALWQYFKGDITTPVTGRPAESADVHQSIEANLHPHQLRVLAAAKAYGHLGLEEMFAFTGLSWPNNRRAVWLLWYMGILEVEKVDGRTIVRFVPPEKRPGLPMPEVKSAKRIAA